MEPSGADSSQGEIRCVSYFSENYSRLTFPLADGEKPGFREAQRGALFAIGSHFSGRNDPAIITMPTGTGKTAVLQASAFLLQAKRVAYTYDLKRAYQDGVFGHIQFQLVDQIPPGDNRQQMEDIATAKAAERKLAADRAAGFDHL